METEHYTFADSTTGLAHAFELTLALRAYGFATRLETTTFKGFTLHTIVAVAAERPNRKARGADLCCY
jgi:hypothetical protein